MVNARLLRASAGGGAPGARLEYPLQSFDYRMKAEAGASAGRAGNIAATTIGFEPKGFTMRTKVVNEAAFRPQRNIGRCPRSARRHPPVSRIVHLGVLE
jgi:hypothetical protein